MLNPDKSEVFFVPFFFFHSIVSLLNVFSNLLQKKSNGAPNGFYAEIDWERYVSIRRLFVFINISERENESRHSCI